MPTDVRPVMVNFQGNPIPDGANIVQVMANSGASAQSTATLGNGQAWEVTARTTDVRVLVGSNPTATATSIPCLAGTTRWFYGSVGDKIAVIDL